MPVLDMSRLFTFYGHHSKFDPVFIQVDVLSMHSQSLLRKPRTSFVFRTWSYTYGNILRFRW